MRSVSENLQLKITDDKQRRSRTMAEIEETSSADPAIVEVILTRGRGKKRCYNGVRALVNPKEKRRGGWATAQVPATSREDISTIRWRSNAWVLPQLSLIDLPNDVVCNILDFLICPGREESEIFWRDSDGHETDPPYRPADSREPGKADLMISLKDIALLCKQVLPTCRHLKALCLKYFCDTGIDANFFAVRSSVHVPCILWLTRHQVTLRSLKIRATSTDTAILAHMLQHCNTKAMKTVEVRIERIENTMQDTSLLSTCLVRQAWEARHGPLVIDLSTVVEPPSQTEMALALGVPPVTAHAPFLSDVKLHDLVAEASRCITRLRVNISLDPMHPQSDCISSSLFSMSSLLYLDLGVKFRRYGYPGPPMNDCSTITQLVGQLPNLKELCLRGNHTSRWIFCRLNSRSLEVIHVEDSSKAFWVSECICPLLKRFVCKGFGYGNGVRPSLQSSEEIFSFRGRNKSYPASHGFQGMKVPDSCTVFFTD